MEVEIFSPLTPDHPPVADLAVADFAALGSGCS
jgi:hypothetical protein